MSNSIVLILQAVSAQFVFEEKPLRLASSRAVVSILEVIHSDAVLVWDLDGLSSNFLGDMAIRTLSSVEDVLKARKEYANPAVAGRPAHVLILLLELETARNCNCRFWTVYLCSSWTIIKSPQYITWACIVRRLSLKKFYTHGHDLSFLDLPFALTVVQYPRWIVYNTYYCLLLIMVKLTMSVLYHVAPKLTGLGLKAFVWALEFQPIGRPLLGGILKKNKTLEVLLNDSLEKLRCSFILSYWLAHVICAIYPNWELQGILRADT